MTTPTRRGAISLANAIFLFILVAAIGTVLYIRGGGASNAGASDGLFQPASTFDEAKAAAASEGKFVFVLATADWCPPCRSFRGGTLADPAVQDRITEVAVPYKLDVTNQQLPQHDAELAQMLNVSSIPAVYVVDANNNIVASSMGDMSTRQINAWLDNNVANQ